MNTTKLVIVWLVHLIFNVSAQAPFNDKSLPGLKTLTTAESTRMSQIHQNWSKVQNKICELNEEQSKQLNERIEECNKLSFIYKIQQLLKPCMQLKGVSNPLSYLQVERSECLYEQCYMKVMESPEYQKIVADVAKMTNEERLDQAEKRFSCSLKVLGI